MHFLQSSASFKSTKYFKPKWCITFEVSIANEICRFIHLCRSLSQTQDEFQIFTSSLDEERTKCILFGSKLKLKNAGKLNIMYNGIEIKQYSKVTYLGCLLDETMSGESMTLKTI